MTWDSGISWPNSKNGKRKPQYNNWESKPSSQDILIRRQTAEGEDLQGAGSGGLELTDYMIFWASGIITAICLTSLLEHLKKKLAIGTQETKQMGKDAIAALGWGAG